MTQPPVDPQRKSRTGIQPDVEVEPQVAVYPDVPIAGVVHRVFYPIDAVRLESGYPLDGIGGEGIADPGNNGVLPKTVISELKRIVQLRPQARITGDDKQGVGEIDIRAKLRNPGSLDPLGIPEIEAIGFEVALQEMDGIRLL